MDEKYIVTGDKEFTFDGNTGFTHVCDGFKIAQLVLEQAKQTCDVVFFSKVIAEYRAKRVMERVP